MRDSSIYGRARPTRWPARRPPPTWCGSSSPTQKLPRKRSRAAYMAFELARAHEAAEHLSDLNCPGPARYDGISLGEGPQLGLTVTLDDAETPRLGAVKHRSEDDHLTGLDIRLPVGGVTSHDLSFVICHVERERRTWRLESEYECAHGARIATSPGELGPAGVLVGADG